MQEWINTIKTQMHINPSTYLVEPEDVLKLIAQIEKLWAANESQQALVGIATRKASQLQHFNLLLRKHIAIAQLTELEKEIEKYYDEMEKFHMTAAEQTLDECLLRLIELNENPDSIKDRFIQLDGIESGETG